MVLFRSISYRFIDRPEKWSITTRRRRTCTCISSSKSCRFFYNRIKPFINVFVGNRWRKNGSLSSRETTASSSKKWATSCAPRPGLNQTKILEFGQIFLSFFFKPIRDWWITGTTTPRNHSTRPSASESSSEWPMRIRYKAILSSPPIVSFSGSEKRETKWGNETKCGETIGGGDSILPQTRKIMKMMKLKMGGY